LYLNLRKKLVELSVEQSRLLKFGHIEKYIRDEWKVLKCVAGEEKK